MEELPKKAKEIQDKIREALVSTDLDMREFLGINKALQTIKGELILNTSKLTEIEINKHIERDTEKLEEVENDLTYSDDPRQLYGDGLDDLNIQKKASLEIPSQNRKDLHTQIARIKQTLEKVLEKDTSLAEKNCTLFHEQEITIFSILTAISMTILTIVLTIAGVFGGSGGTGGSPSTPEDEGGVLKKWLDKLANALNRLIGKAVEALPATIASIVGTILSFFKQGRGIRC